MNNMNKFDNLDIFLVNKFIHKFSIIITVYYNKIS